jgi:uncharacterized membrane protein
MIAAGSVAGAVEAIGGRGWDNLFVVMAVIVVLVPIAEASVGAVDILMGLGGGGLVTGAGMAVGVLTREGAVAAGLFAASLVSLGGLPWAVPGFAFFGLSSALSVLPGAEREAGTAPRRTLRQVLANGGVAWGLHLGAALSPATGTGLWAVAFAGFLGALAAAAADTWATELGTRYAGRPWSLRDGTRVPRGSSGAVSGIGTLGAALGATSVVGAALVAAPQPPPGLLGTGIAAGLAGMAVDSLAGATIQSREGAECERPGSAKARPSRGWRWVDNDVVNLFGTTTGAIVAIGMALGL